MIQNIQIAWRYTNTIGKIKLVWYLSIQVPSFILHELSHFLMLTLFLNFTFKFTGAFLEYNTETKEYETYLQGTYETSSNLLAILVSIAPIITLCVLIYISPKFMITYYIIGGRGFNLSKQDLNSFKISLNNLLKCGQYYVK